MKTFHEFYLMLEDPLANISMPAAPPAGGPPMGAGGPAGMPPPGGGMGPMPPLGGAMGAPPPMGGMGAPMGGGMGAPATPPVKLKPVTVWNVVEKILSGKTEELEDNKPKQSGQQQNNMLPSPQQLPQQPPAMDPTMMQQQPPMPQGQPPMPGM